ncbi:MAG: cation:dicarboxylase symporter family transporter [Thiohalocapsa sp.]|jgi:Na+/H+-dicarboxylate symporter/ABC-type amino acid transport substrate-binding protein|uniref:cation:dicarboxylate symporter family transporter n=1 Tax=Thiohalocapsa sp. TaxID=2497641 RepID=UPI0025F28E66|nr:cation:dicarboxylase symporter family transporter [Thiohalocapsa sp.]MCG6942616.1 cation:dicarboxylase symporter family transporter [Thiohalocapsa sp.]
MSVATQVFIGLGLGLLTGLFFGERAAFLRVGGDIFIAALQITVIPYVMVALITSLGRLDLQDARNLALKAGSILLLLWAIGLAIVFLAPLAFPDWPSASFFSTSQIEDQPPVDFLRLYIPSNVFYALSNAIVPAVVIFSILLGVALIQVPGKDGLLDVLSTVGEALMRVTGFIGRLAPYGVFAITAAAAGTIDVGDLARLQVYLVLHSSLALLLSLWILPGLVALLTPLRYWDVLRAFRGPLVTAFATASLLIVLPVLAADGKRLLAEADPETSKPDPEAKSAIDILVPAAFPFPNMGLIMALLFVPFAGWFIGAGVDVVDYPIIAGAGLASLFGGTVLALPFLFDLLRMPADLFQVFVTMDVVAARFGTLAAGMHVIALALIGSYAMQGRLRVVPKRLLGFVVITLALLAAILIGVRAFYTHVFVAPFTTDKVLAGLALRGEPQPHQVFRAWPGTQALRRGATALARIQDSGVLRVCYRGSDYPSAFFNSAGDLVGFDIELAHRFARHLSARIEFLPVQSAKDAARRLDAGGCDVFMSLLPIAPETTLNFTLTQPVLNGAVGLVVEDWRRRSFRTWRAIRAQSDLRIAVADEPAQLQFLSQLLPHAEPLRFTDNAELNALLAAQPPAFDALLMSAEEGAAWSIRFPRYTLVTPTPILLAPFGYAVAAGDSELLTFFDAWLQNARSAGIVDKLYRYWMLGEIDATRPPRWSIARDLLGWLD